MTAAIVQCCCLIFAVIAMGINAGMVPGEMDWCGYWRSIGQPKPECSPKKNTTETPTTRAPSPTNRDSKGVEAVIMSKVTDFGLGKLKMTMCQGPDYQKCNTDLNCASRTSCLFGTEGRCCLPVGPHIVAPKIFEQCPSIDVMKIRCAVSKPTSWCNSNYDCHNTPVKLCCPTGCGYNMCIQSQGYVIDNGSGLFTNALL